MNDFQATRLRAGLRMLAEGNEWQPLSALQVRVKWSTVEILREAEAAGLIEVREMPRRPGSRGPVGREARVTRKGMAWLAPELEAVA